MVSITLIVSKRVPPIRLTHLGKPATCAGQGIAVLPTFIIGAALASGALVQVLEVFALPSAAVYAVYPQHRQSARIVQLFSDYLRDRLTAAS
ncbi:LysR substrate-binding domain-containing protein [Pseudomonas oryzihabitans]|uniref:LysR substrate-binding domain-containing protein n=1 Tax=Pseudomonas oryzihabitans TaxID=47885 RepID=A0A2Z5A3X2_9PSED|nr:LysR substrate-binding domain-containing protein [Pseudomonas oryzihabitans]AXA65104.1 hypothetical protein CE139_04565 [Pseudomonas oryzihabitans]